MLGPYLASFEVNRSIWKPKIEGDLLSSCYYLE